MSTEAPPSDALERLRAVIRGAVQGVGFRPFVHRLATELKLAGWVSNSNEGVVLEVEGSSAGLRQFLVRLGSEKPPLAVIHSLEPLFLDSVGLSGFSIRESGDAGAKTTIIQPDIATCADCLKDISHPHNRRYRYPFTNCTHCGPRYSLIEDLPYDRARTTMAKFRMCPDCEWEYHNPLDRRFHAQPIACPACGPQLALWDKEGNSLASRQEALSRAAAAIAAGQVVAVKGLGGFHLCVDARSEKAVETLRQRKHRQEKPFAVMVPSLEAAKALCEISEMEERLLCSAEAPIVLLKRRAKVGSPSVTAGNDVRSSSPSASVGDPSAVIAEAVAPRNPYLGLMLPYTPLHHLLLKEFPFPLVATSGNMSEEPICIDEREALIDLCDLADLFLVHDRPISRPVDDSVALVVEGRELLLRRARGYAPLPILISESAAKVLAVGAHLKNTIAITVDKQAILSQHLGELETASAFRAFRSTIGSFERLYAFEPELVMCDLHPNYVSTHYAHERNCPVVPVQHHYAHILSCMADNDLEGPVLGVAWDGTGFGLDHTVWGGEFLRVGNTQGFERAAHLRTFRLPGNEKAVREPRRSALGLLFEIFGEWVFDGRTCAPLQAFTEAELSLLQPMLTKGIQTPITSSVGRLFDAVASLLDLRQMISFEGQAAMELEFAATGHESEGTYPIEMTNWEPMIHGLLDEFQAGVPVGILAAKFHNTLVEMIVQVARHVQEPKVVLSGGCFQNRYLLSRAIRRLREEGFVPYWHQRVPPNDGGIALGQVMAAVRQQTDGGDNYVSGRSR